ncbi:unnamed protein product, partial [Timema podura]|nr:unnamed protein product [Timema podura]
MDLDEDGMLNDSTKDERKKLLPRTRSGRLSRPPRHMVKDYKRLHHLDFADADLDDSDGGYSDYQVSEPEEGEPEKAESKEELLEEPNLYKMVAFGGKATGVNPFNIVNSAFKEDCISCNNCSSMSSDGEKAKAGELNSVLSRVRE